MTGLQLFGKSEILGNCALGIYKPETFKTHQKSKYDAESKQLVEFSLSQVTGSSQTTRKKRIKNPKEKALTRVEKWEDTVFIPSLRK